MLKVLLQRFSNFNFMHHLSCKIFIFLLLLSSVAVAQRHKIASAKVKEADILWRKIVVREVMLSDSGENAPLLKLTDSLGKHTDICQLFYDMVQDTLTWKNRSVMDSALLQENILAVLRTKKIKKLIILEEWKFSREKGKMLVNILLIGPYVEGVVTEDKRYRKLNKMFVSGEKNNQPLFFMKYQSIGARFEQYSLMLTNKKSLEAMNCYELFESRLFSSRIIFVADNYDGVLSPLLNKSDTDVWVY